jgi:hypothetical protein
VSGKAMTESVAGGGPVDAAPQSSGLLTGLLPGAITCV